MMCMGAWGGLFESERVSLFSSECLECLSVRFFTFCFCRLEELTDLTCS